MSKCTECGTEISWDTKQCSSECFEEYQWKSKEVRELRRRASKIFTNPVDALTAFKELKKIKLKEEFENV